MEDVNPLHIMQTQVQLSGFRYITCLKSEISQQNGCITIDKMEYAFENIASIPTSLLFTEFHNWTARTVIRDLVESFSIFLTSLYFRLKGRDNQPRRFERLGLEDQLLTFEREFEVDHRWTAMLSGFNHARNCLAHRGGIVGKSDLNSEDGQLVVRWLRINAISDSTMMKKYLLNELIRAEFISGDKSILANIQDVKKRVALGHSLILLPNEVLEICGTFQIVAAAFSTSGAVGAR